MKKFNKNIIVFVLVSLFIVLGYSINSIKSLMHCSYQFLVINLKSEGLSAFETFASDIDGYSTDLLQYHNRLMDLDSLKHLLINTRLIEKEDTSVVKANNNTLTESCARCPDEVIEHSASVIHSLQMTAEENNADFLYVAVPGKNAIYTTPENIENYALDNYTRYLQALRQKDIPVLDLYDELRQNNMLTANTYFITDHHWTPETGFWATGRICDTLNQQYGFEYNNDYTNIDNYDLKTYPNQFLGSYGKKTGRFFTAGGPDDFTLITPKFETKFTVLQPLKEEEQTGNFEEAVLDTSMLQIQNHYASWTYLTYSGDFRLQIIKNHLNPEGKKILVVRDSCAGVVTPFLALNAGELHIVDVRDFISSDPIDVYGYLRDISPDYVLVLYSGTETPEQTSGKFNFSLPE